MLQKRIAEIIRNLKRVRNENGLTISEIVNICEKNGEAVSETTVKKVFADGSETFGFNYENTLKPIINALLGDHEETAETDMMISVAQYKEIKIRHLGQELHHAGELIENFGAALKELAEPVQIKPFRIKNF